MPAKRKPIEFEAKKKSLKPKKKKGLEESWCEFDILNEGTGRARVRFGGDVDPYDRATYQDLFDGSCPEGWEVCMDSFPEEVFRDEEPGRVWTLPLHRDNWRLP